MKKGILVLLLLFMAMPLTSRSVTITEFPETNLLAPETLSPELKNQIDPKALDLAVKGYYNLKRQGLIRREGIVTLIDFDRPSVNERFYIIDIVKGKILHSALVAHGKGSGENVATRFSNKPGSNKSSVGFYLTENTYIGKNGYSLVLKGLDHGINDKAANRSIVIHGADYVSEDYIRRHGRLGRSQGCPALSMESYQQVIDLIKEGTCLFIYHNGRDYASRSGVLNPGSAFRNVRPDNPA
ncbi:MAG: murein L,D-transpeptidase catalytic domain family protein [Chlorobiaceae bacterium]|nr:murein L,D-transpeptidase catalytic domain family protein [Chlorobiaceae bacterium]